MRSKCASSAAESLELIRAGLAELAASDIDGYTAAGLGAECEEILQAVGGLQLQAARRLARFETLGGPAGEDAPSLAGWLGGRCRLRPWEACRLAATATRLHLLDDTLTAFNDGAIGFGDVATIAEGVDKAAKTMSEGWSAERIAEKAQPILLEAVGEVTPGQLRKAASDRAVGRGRRDERRPGRDTSAEYCGEILPFSDVGRHRPDPLEASEWRRSEGSTSRRPRRRRNCSPPRR